VALYSQSKSAPVCRRLSLPQPDVCLGSARRPRETHRSAATENLRPLEGCCIKGTCRTIPYGVKAVQGPKSRPGENRHALGCAQRHAPGSAKSAQAWVVWREAWCEGRRRWCQCCGSACGAERRAPHLACSWAVLAKHLPPDQVRARGGQLSLHSIFGPATWQALLMQAGPTVAYPLSRSTDICSLHRSESVLILAAGGGRRSETTCRRGRGCRVLN